MTYFHRCPPTIIGAKVFHCPVRDGKEWDHLAMFIKLTNLLWLSISLAIWKKHYKVLCVGYYLEGLLIELTSSHFSEMSIGIIVLVTLVYNTDKVIGSSLTGN